MDTRHSAHSALIPDERDYSGAICYDNIPKATVPSRGGVIGVAVDETTWLRVGGAWSIGFCVFWPFCLAICARVDPWRGASNEDFC